MLLPLKEQFTDKKPCNCNDYSKKNNQERKLDMCIPERKLEDQEHRLTVNIIPLVSARHRGTKKDVLYCLV